MLWTSRNTAAQEKQKEEYDSRMKKGVRAFHIESGISVLKMNMRNETRKGGKTEPKWTGPYK
ncbi:hypothetical protein E2C01_102519 [Portunus trituberculatus]|uniref:Uncharacterized protein n=1 Tax=Portunus trituberculatus TaxID=210409 RepID=A0A5B7KPD1_PORTR|nr:hypothetical protein [Portunus trituberculatus]